MTLHVKTITEGTCAPCRQPARESHLQPLAEPLAAPSVPGQLPSNVLPISLLGADLIVQITEQAPETIPGDELFLLWNGQEVGARHIIDGSETYPLDLSLPVDLLAHEGAFSLQYQVQALVGQDADSLIQTVIIDKTPPHFGNAGAPLVFEQTVEEAGVTLDYLAANNDQLKVTVPRYPDIALNDTLKLYWNTPTFGPVHAVDIVTTQEHLDGGAIEAFIAGEFIRAHGEGPAVNSYFMQDEAGNAGLESEPKSIQVFLTPLPSELPDPVVPLAADGVVDLPDTLMGVTVEIPQIFDALAGDHVVVSWGGMKLPSVTIVDPSAAGFPLVVAVSRPQLLAVGSGNIEVFYEFHRRELVLPSGSIIVTVDIDAPGPPDPDPTTPENELLVAPTVVGGGAQLNNELLAEDLDHEAIVTVPFYAEAQPGEVITVYWGYRSRATALPPHTVTADDVATQSFPVFTAPAAIVNTTPNDAAWPVYYTLSRSDGKNPVLSMTQAVNAHMISPGGPNGLEPAIFPDINEAGWLLPAAVYPGGARVVVPAYENMQAGDRLTLNWVAYSTTNWAAGSEIEGTEYSQTIDLDQLDVGNDLDFVVPYEQYIEPIRLLESKQGSAKVTYTVEQNGDFTAPEALVRIDLFPLS